MFPGWSGLVTGQVSGTTVEDFYSRHTLTTLAEKLKTNDQINTLRPPMRLFLSYNHWKLHISMWENSSIRRSFDISSPRLCWTTSYDTLHVWIWPERTLIIKPLLNLNIISTWFVKYYLQLKRDMEKWSKGLKVYIKLPGEVKMNKKFQFDLLSLSILEMLRLPLSSPAMVEDRSLWFESQLMLNCSSSSPPRCQGSKSS